MAQTLQEAIDYATAPTDPTPFGLETWSLISMHDDEETLMYANPGFPNFTFRPDLPLLNWGPVTFRSGGLVGHWVRPTQIPGFSTRGQGGITLQGSGASISIDFSVRRDPGRSPFNVLFRPSIQIEIDKLSAAGTPTDGVTLNAVEDGALVRAVGPSLRDPASRASYTFTIRVWARIG
jgi:hypothetical protein